MGGVGFALAAGRAVWLRVIAAAVGVVLGFALFTALDGAADLLPDSTGWFHEEAGLWAVALVTLAVAWWQRQRQATGTD